VLDAEPIHSNVPALRQEPRPAPWAVLGAVSAGGAIGALARYGLTAAFPAGPGGFGWAVFAVNVAGCLLIGVLMVAITEVWRAHPLVRPFLGVGVLGGFTTFSAYVMDAHAALSAGAPRTALAYLAGTALAAPAAVAAGAWAMRLLARRLTGQGRR